MATPSPQAKCNLKTICNALGSIRTKWLQIGIQLGIPRSKLMEFKKDDDPFLATIDYWLRGNATESLEPVSWDSVVTALKSVYVGEPGLANEIQKNYCQQAGKLVGQEVAIIYSNDENVAATPTSDSSEQVVPVKKDQVEKASVNSTIQPSEERASSEMNPDMRRELEIILERNLKEIIAKYASYVDCLCIAIEEKGITADRLRSYLLSLSATSIEGEKLALLSDKENQLQKCNTVTDIFNFLTTKCASFLNYDIFQFILKRYNVTDPEILKYPEHLKDYIEKHKISEFSKINPQVIPKNGSKELILKYDIETTCRLAKLTDLKKLIADILGISSLALEIVDIEEGCVIVTFFIPVSVANALFSPDTVFTPQQEEKLRAAPVLWLKCNGQTFHFEKKQHKDEALQKLKEQLTCSICLGIYTDPKQLQCQHAYCQQCLMGLVQQDQQGQPTLTCPTCRQVTHVPVRGVAGLQADFRANQLLEIVNKDWKESTLAAKPQLANSDLASIELSMHEIALPHCPDHDNILMEVYCGTCKEAICWKCSRGKHHEHNCEALDEALKRCKEDILSLSKAIVSALAIIDTRRDEISIQQAAIEEEIHCTITEDIRKTELISQLHQLTQTKIKSLAAHRDQLETFQTQLDKFMRETGNQREAPLKKSNRIKQMQKLTTTFELKLLELNTKADMIYLSPAVDITGNGNVCERQSLDISKYCIASTGTGIAIVGETSTTSLQIRCPIQVSFISCELVSEITGTKIRGNIRRIGQSQYKISYQPTVRGRHQLHITVEGEHIRKSPFSVTARSPVETLGTPILTIGGVEGPQGIAVNQRGEAVVAEMSIDMVSVFSPNGERLRSFGTRGSDEGQFKCPYGVALDTEGNILVTDRDNHRIQKFTPQGEFLKSVGTKGTGTLEFVNPSGIAFNASNNKVYVLDWSSRIQVLNSDLSYLNTLGKEGSGEVLRYIACDSTGHLYVTYNNSCCIKVFTADGEFIKVLAKDNNKKKSEFFGIAIDSSDKVYTTDYDQNNISVYTCEGQFLTSFGREQGGLYLPTGIAVDDSGVVYVCDLANNRVHLF